MSSSTEAEAALPTAAPAPADENAIVRKRIENHEKNKAIVQERLKELCTDLLDEVNKLEARISADLEQAFAAEEARQQQANLPKPNDCTDGVDGKVEHVSQKYSVVKSTKAKDVCDKIHLKIKKVESNETTGEDSTITLEELSEQHRKNKEKAKGKLLKMCNELREEVKGLEQEISSDLEEESASEDEKLQKLLSEKDTDEDTMLNELIMGKVYGIEENEESSCIKDRYTLVAAKGIWGLEEMRVKEFYIREVKNGRVYLVLELFEERIKKMLEERGVIEDITVRVSMWKKGENDETLSEYVISSEGINHFTPEILKERNVYCARVRIEYEEQASEWSKVVEFTTPRFSELCGWKKCPPNIENWRQYVIDDANPKMVESRNDGGSKDYSSAIIGNTIIPLNKITTWNIKVSSYLVSINGKSTYIGVAPFDTDQSNKSSFLKSGWYFCCYDSTLRSGPPHNYHDKEYGPRKKKGHYIKKDSAVGVIIDTAKRDISFALDYENIGVAYEGIPIDKPLVLCAFATSDRISFELNFAEIKGVEKASHIPAPGNVSISDSTWDSITLTWDAIDGASFYQIESVEIGRCDGSTTNKFTKAELCPETEYSFRVRAMRGNEAGPWCDSISVRTKATPALSEYTWKKCPDDVIEDRKYCIDENSSLIAIKNGACGGYSTVITNIPLPSNTVTSWKIKILKSKEDNGRGIFVGVAPYDIYQRIDNDYKYTYSKCGWYFDCYCSTLRSGPPHFFCGEKKYGGIKDKNDGEYVHNGEVVGVIMDTRNGKLCFCLGDINLGVGYKGIPIDKPLVPCVLIEAQGDSVEIEFSSDIPEQSCVIS